MGYILSGLGNRRLSLLIEGFLLFFFIKKILVKEEG